MRTDASRTLVRAAVFVAVAALLAPAAHAQEVKEVEAVGEAAVVNGDKGHARERATEDALRKAVEQAVGTMINATSETKDFQLVQDNILTQARGYVTGYDVLEARTDGTGDAMSMVVKVKARVGMGKLTENLQALGLLLAAKQMPRVAVLVTEQHIGQTAPSAWWGPQGGGQQGGSVMTVSQRIVENTLIAEWQKAGFTFVDMDVLAGKIRQKNMVSVNPSDSDAREIGNLADADVVIVGQAIATKQGDIGAMFNDKSGDIQMVSCSGSISARAINTDNGEILATADAKKVAAHIDTLVCDRTALQNAAKTFAAEMQKTLADRWSKEQGGGMRVRMTVKGLDSFKALNDFKSLLQSSLRGVQQVNQKSFKNGMADLDVRIKGRTDDLAGDLEARPLGRFKVRVTGATANTLEVELAK